MYLYFVTIRTLNSHHFDISTKSYMYLYKSFNNHVHHRVSHGATEEINSDKTKGKIHQDTKLDTEEMHINPGPDLITRKRTNAILLYFLVCFEYCLSPSVQIMSLLEIICLRATPHLALVNTRFIAFTFWA